MNITTSAVIIEASLEKELEMFNELSDEKKKRVLEALNPHMNPNRLDKDNNVEYIN